MIQYLGFINMRCFSTFHPVKCLMGNDSACQQLDLSQYFLLTINQTQLHPFHSFHLLPLRSTFSTVSCLMTYMQHCFSLVYYTSNHLPSMYFKFQYLYTKYAFFHGRHLRRNYFRDVDRCNGQGQFYLYTVNSFLHFLHQTCSCRIMQL